jgi:hypothetical protein
MTPLIARMPFAGVPSSRKESNATAPIENRSATSAGGAKAYPILKKPVRQDFSGFPRERNSAAPAVTADKNPTTNAVPRTRKTAVAPAPEAMPNVGTLPSTASRYWTAKDMPMEENRNNTSFKLGWFVATAAVSEQGCLKTTPRPPLAPGARQRRQATQCCDSDFRLRSI